MPQQPKWPRKVPEMKRPSEVFSSIRYAKGKSKDKPHSSTDNEEHYTVGEKEYEQQIKHVKKMAMQEQSDTMEKVEMVKSQLHFIKYACEEILEYIDMGGEVEEWYQVKVAKSFSEFESLHAFMEGESRRKGMKEEVEQLDELSPSTISSYKTQAQKSIQQLKPHAEKGEYRDIAKNIMQRRQKGLAAAMKREEVEQLDEKNVPTNPELWSRAKAMARSKFDVYPSAYANGWAAKWYKSKGGGWKSVNEAKSEMAMGIKDEMGEHGMSKEQAAKTASDHLKSNPKYYSTLKKAGLEESCWSGYEQKGMKKKGNRMVPNCVPVEEENVDDKFEAYMLDTHNRDMGTTSLRNIYAKMTPGQESIASQQPIKPISYVAEEKKKMKLVRKNLAQEDNNVPRFGLPMGGGIGPEITQYRPFTVTGFTGNLAGTPSLAESISSWANNPKTQQKFIQKYGDLAEEKLNEAAMKLEQCGCGMEMPKTKKSVAKIKETWPAAPYKSTYDDMGTVASTGKEEQLNERGADSKGLYRPTEKGAGLTRKGAKHFGIKTAVTTPPSKLDPKGKAAKRRKSFCARMGGMKGPMKDEKGRPTRKAMSLRRWNCEE